VEQHWGNILPRQPPACARQALCARSAANSRSSARALSARSILSVTSDTVVSAGTLPALARSRTLRVMKARPRDKQRSNAGNSQRCNWPRRRHIARDGAVGTSHTFRGDSSRRADNSAGLAPARHSPPGKRTSLRVRQGVHISYRAPFASGHDPEGGDIDIAGVNRGSKKILREIRRLTARGT